MQRLARVLVVTTIFGIGLCAAQPAWAFDDAKGKIKSVQVDQKQFTLTNGEDKIFHIDDTTKITLNGREAKLGDLMANDQAEVTYEKKGDQLHASQVKATREPSEPVALAATLVIQEQQQQKASGKIKTLRVDAKEFILTDKDGKDWTFKVNDQTKVMLNGKEATFAELMVDDQAEVSYQQQEDLYTATAITATRAKDQ